MKVVAYTRVSTSEQGKSGLGLEAQLEYIKRFCEVNKLELVDHYQDVVSGKLDCESERPNIHKAFKQAKKLGGAVVVSKLDRLSRRAAFIMNLMEDGVKFISAERGIDVEPFMLHLDAILAEKERKTIGERTRWALGAKKARGEALGVHTHRDPAATQAKAAERGGEAVKTAADAFAKRIASNILRMQRDNMTLGQIARELNEQGTRTARGGKWHASTVCNVLQRINGNVV